MHEQEQARLREVIRRMKQIQKSLGSDDQPVSEFQIAELRKLGSEYQKIIEVLGKNANTNKLS